MAPAAAKFERILNDWLELSIICSLIRFKTEKYTKLGELKVTSARRRFDNTNSEKKIEVKLTSKL